MIRLSFGDVRKKKISTRNHFVSHMIEHIAWRMGLSIELEYASDDWKNLGFKLGLEIRKFPCRASEAVALGMIDDGSASIALTKGDGDVDISAIEAVDLEWFLNSRCEQLSTGKPLIDLAKGLSEGLGIKIGIQIWSVEDPHHTWEGIFRGIGIALGKMFMPESERAQIASKMLDDQMLEYCDDQGEIVVLDKGINQARVRRGTAETGITVGINFLTATENQIRIDVDESIKGAIRDFYKLLSEFSKKLGASLEIDFKATSLSSSHVVMEDIGLVLGRTLLEILKLRMGKYGQNGAGSNLETLSDVHAKNVRVGVSIEGRKFWRLIPEDGDLKKFRKDFLIGCNILEGLRSEDLDDFIDGLSGGMCASIMVHIKDYSHAGAVWLEAFAAIGEALREAFIANPYRRGVPPGVKATLA